MRHSSSSVAMPRLLKTLLCTAMFAAAGHAMAQGFVVPPPAPPAGVKPAGQVPATVQTGMPGTTLPRAVPQEVPAAVDGVLPPAKTGAPVGVKQGDPIDIVLPPPPERPPAVDLKPAAPKKAEAKKDVAAPKKSSGDSIRISDDPFAGIAAMPVSDSQLNRFVFPEAIEGVYFPEGTPLPECPKDAGPQDPCKPVFLNGKRMMLLQLRAGAQGPVQMLVSLRSGRMVTLNLAPTRGPGAVIRVDGAEDGASDTRLAAGANKRQAGGLAASEADVALVSRFARGEMPAGFESVPIVGSPARYDLFDVIPMATWSNGAGQQVRLLQVRPFGKEAVVIAPGMFRGPGVKALALDRETITTTQPAMLFVLDAVAEER